MSFEAKDYPISDILNKVVFDIPRNQRRYVWKKSSWQDLFEDVLFSITEEKPHFIGSIVLKKGSKKDGLSYYTIIDGQQRLTTITLFLVAIMKHFHENDMMDDFWGTVATVYKGNIIKNLIMDCQSYTKYRPNETTGGIFVSWRRKEELPTGA